MSASMRNGGDKAPGHSLEVWGGLECTLARVADGFRDQVRETGHFERLDDLDRVAELGIRTLRYPVLWETVSPREPGERNWSWHDPRLKRLRDAGTTVIAGLVHHGSGPVYTDLLQRDFPQRLARHAAAVARRYPWLDAYTPVNEPLTTARFSCLYGHWHPHGRSYRDFLAALVNQCRATVEAMRAIRRINPSARLVQTDDLGRVFSMPALDYQADYENERRWLTFDLLFGRVDRHHPFWDELMANGIPARDLEPLLDREVVPDVVGINHYLTSDRFLDPRIERYPAHLVGGNAWSRYADVEAARVPGLSRLLGPRARLREVWERYRAPTAITEVHHGSTRDEQLRWLATVWKAAEAERRAGADIRAVTIWSLFGTVDWNSLLTRRAGIYEPGAFDVRGGQEPRPTAIAAANRSLSRTGRFSHPVLESPGWWRRIDRFYRPPSPRKRSGSRTERARRIGVIGPDGPIRRAFLEAASRRGLPVALAAAAGSGRGAQPPVALAGLWALLDLGGPAAASRLADRDLLAKAQAAGLPCLRVLSPDGDDGRPGRRPRNAMAGRDTSRPDGLPASLPAPAMLDRSLLIRTGSPFSPGERDALLAPLLLCLAQGRSVGALPAQVSLTYLPDLAHVALDLLIDGARGVWEVTSGEPVDGATLLRLLEERTGLAARDATGDLGGGAVLPPKPDRAPARSGTALMPPLASALDRFLHDCGFDWRSSGFQVAAE